MASKWRAGMERSAFRECVSRLKMKPGENQGCGGWLHKGPFFSTWADNQHVGSAFVKKNYGRAVAWAHSKCVPLLLTESAWAVFTQNWDRVRSHLQVIVTWSSPWALPASWFCLVLGQIAAALSCWLMVVAARWSRSFYPPTVVSL